MTLAAGSTNGVHVICFAESASGGDTSTDFAWQNVRMQVVAPTVQAVTPLHSSGEKIVSHHSIAIKVDGSSAAVGDVVAFLPTSVGGVNYGCQNSSVKRLQLTNETMIIQGPLLAEGTYKICHTQSGVDWDSRIATS